MIHFTCACGRELQAREDLADQTAACPMCGRAQAVPSTANVRGALQPGEQPSSVVVAVQPGAEGPPFGFRDSERARQSLTLGVFSLLGLSVLTGLPAMILGLLALRDIRRSQGQQIGRWRAITGIVTGSVGTVGIVLIVYVIGQVRQTAARTQVSNNLKQLAVGIASYQGSYDRLPPATFRGPVGQEPVAGPPLFSWRLGLMPYVEAGTIYSDYNKTSAWDSPANLPFLGSRPKVYALPDDKEPDPDGRTVYQVFVGPGTAFEGPAGVPLRDFPRGTSHTVFVAEAASGVPWTKPQDLPYDPKQPLPALGGHVGEGFLAVMGDGSVRWVAASTDEAVIRALITRNGGEPVPP